MAVYENVLGTIGNTPLIELSRLAAHEGVQARIIAKFEAMNPGGSIKDRAALSMLRDAETHGALAPGGLIVEPTSGNTGVGLAMASAVLGYRLILTMPETMSVERRKLLAQLGAEIVLTPGAQGMQGAVDEANRIASEQHGFVPMQFVNPANAHAHMQTTGPEIIAAMDAPVAALVATFGTGGTVTGTGRSLKAHDPSTRVVAVEPAESPLLSQGKSGPHGIQGIGANFIPELLDRTVIDEVLTCTTPRALEIAKLTARLEGMLAGISSGAALAAAIELGKRPEYAGRAIVAILPDTGERYISTALFG